MCFLYFVQQEIWRFVVKETLQSQCWYFLWKATSSEINFQLGLKKKLFGFPPPPAPNFWKLEKVFTVQKYAAPNFQYSPKKVFFFSLKILIF